MEETTTLPEGQPTMRLLARPMDTNSSGDIFGGWIMSQVDLAGSIEARRYARNRVVTVAVNSFHFKKPVYVGDLVSCYATIKKVGRTSITVFVEVYAERNIKEVTCIKVTEAILTFVAIDEHGKSHAVPK